MTIGQREAGDEEEYEPRLLPGARRHGLQHRQGERERRVAADIDFSQGQRRDQRPEDTRAPDRGAIAKVTGGNQDSHQQRNAQFFGMPWDFRRRTARILMAPVNPRAVRIHERVKR